MDNNSYRRNNKHEQYTLNSEIRYKLLNGELYLYSNFNRDYHGLPGERITRALEGRNEYKTDRLSAETPSDWAKENNIAFTLGGLHNFNNNFGIVLDGNYTVKDQDAYYADSANHIVDTVLRHYSFTPRFNYDYEIPESAPWHCKEGYGSLITDMFKNIPVQLNTKVKKIDWSGTGVKVITDKGEIKSNKCIITVSTGVLN